ncbi:uncharacterized protein [Epargyreus clarus]|uniref:uncharacterized protein n=1 Tax=Epargyreus clarus TaxID=520877 RepID=UPI003C2D3E52
MKAILCVLLLAAVAVYGAEEKKNEKRGLLGLGYGLGHGGYYGGHGLGLYGGHGYYSGHGLDLYGGHGFYGGHGVGLYGHSIAAAPVVSHTIAAPAPILSHGLYGSHGVAIGAPLVGLGHGWH